MKLKPIKTSADYEEALERLEEIFDSPLNSPEGDELELLSLLIEKYEDEHFPIDLPDPVEAIKFRMEQLGLQPKDLVSILGLQSRVSEILNRKRKLTLKMIRRLHKQLNIPTQILIKEY